jgi:hypothetical protein
VSKSVASSLPLFELSLWETMGGKTLGISFDLEITAPLQQQLSALLYQPSSRGQGVKGERTLLQGDQSNHRPSHLPRCSVAPDQRWRTPLERGLLRRLPLPQEEGALGAGLYQCHPGHGRARWAFQEVSSAGRRGVSLRALLLGGVGGAVSYVTTGVLDTVWTV